MKLYEICPSARQQGIPDAEIRSVTDNTKELQKDDIFVCIKGNSFDGHSAAKEMLEKGAAAVVAEYDLGLEKQVIVSDTRKYYAVLAAAFYGNPEKKLKMIGVTGTNGKTTVTHLIKAILEHNGKKCACLGTAGNDVCGRVYESGHNNAPPTTPRQMELFGLLSQAVSNGAEYCVMEASSQALAQSRLYGIQFEVGIFTNLTQDHLDSHGTMENYYKAKKLLFDQSSKALVCIDDKYGRRLYDELTIPKKSYSISDAADYYSVNIKCGPSFVSYWFSSEKDEKSFPVKFGMPGLFNVANSIAAAAACVEAGFGINGCIEALQSCKGIRGRCEVIYNGKFTVICDYAHTADALEKILTAVKEFAQERIICVFGAAGERDAGKRPDMGLVVGKNADFAVLTSDNPRFEDPYKIMEQVEKGLDKTMIRYEAIENRREAIEFALGEAREGDIVLLCGKGHETYQVYGDDYQPFDEHLIVKEILKS